MATVHASTGLGSACTKLCVMARRSETMAKVLTKITQRAFVVVTVKSLCEIRRLSAQTSDLSTRWSTLAGC
jgi:hypothetical protein